MSKRPIRWDEIESKVFTRVQYYLKTNPGKYPKINCTTKNSNAAPTTFPTMYLHELPSVEYGNTLDNTEINAVMSTIEVQVYVNTTENDAKKILVAITTEMKNMGYSVTAFPIVTTSNNVSTGVARFRRMVGLNDAIFRVTVN